MSNSIVVFEDWVCERKLRQICLQFNLKQTQTQIDLSSFFNEIERRKSPYFLQGSPRYQAFADELNEYRPFQRGPGFYYWIRHFNPDDDAKISEEAFINCTLNELTSLTSYSILITQLQKNSDFLENLTLELARRYQCPVGINAYFTPKRGQTFDRHFDTHDVFIFQIHGEKKWRIYDSDPARPGQMKVILEKMLVPGDVLYIPMGFYHDAVTEDSFSVHFTFGFYQTPELVLKNWVHEKFSILNPAELSGPDLRLLNFLYCLKTFRQMKNENSFYIFEDDDGDLRVFTKAKELLIPKSLLEELEEAFDGNINSGVGKVLLNEGIIKA